MKGMHIIKHQCGREYISKVQCKREYISRVQCTVMHGNVLRCTATYQTSCTLYNLVYTTNAGEYQQIFTIN